MQYASRIAYDDAAEFSVGVISRGVDLVDHRIDPSGTID
jgi:hypothetical protein